MLDLPTGLYDSNRLVRHLSKTRAKTEAMLMHRSAYLKKYWALSAYHAIHASTRASNVAPMISLFLLCTVQ